jgi:hypothetical protein
MDKTFISLFLLLFLGIFIFSNIYFENMSFLKNGIFSLIAASLSLLFYFLIEKFKKRL